MGGRLASVLAVLAAAVTEGFDRAEKPDDEARRKKERLITRTTQGYLTYVLLPLWTIPGFADYLCHRRTKIESTSGTQESITHCLMMGSIGVPTVLSLFFETNALTLGVAAAATAFHELVIIWDVSYADSRRRVSPIEQQIHSFLEVLPFMTLSILACLHADQALALFGVGSKPDFKLRLRAEPLPKPFVSGLLCAVTLALALPYAEELIRCIRVNPSPLSRPKQRER